MNHRHLGPGLALAASLAAIGCGNGVEDDPLAGTWSNTECLGMSEMPADLESCSSALTFTNDLDIELRTDWISLAATATNPGCTTTRKVTGQKWSADHEADTFTVTGRGDATIERSSCVDSEDDLAATATSDIDIPSGDTSYTISGDTLSVESGALRGTYNR